MQRHRLGRAAVCGTAIMAITAIFSGCHRRTHEVTAADVAAAQAEAQKELSEARLEATKDVRNAAKLAGADSKNVMVARATGSFDIAMVNADGTHKVAMEQCLTLPKDGQQPCKDRADADYQAAAAGAKALRIAQLQKAP